MNNEEFVKIVKTIVRDQAVEDTLENLHNPPGRKISETEKKRSQWYNSLDEQQKNYIESIVLDSVSEAVFGFFCVIDGVRKFDDDNNEATLSLVYKGANEVVLNNMDKTYLHDIFNSSD